MLIIIAESEFVNTTNTDHDLFKVFKVLFYGLITNFHDEVGLILSNEKVKELNLSKEEYDLGGLLKETFDAIMYLVENYDDLATRNTGNLDMLLYSKYELELATITRKYNNVIWRSLANDANEIVK